MKAKQSKIILFLFAVLVLTTACSKPHSKEADPSDSATESATPTYSDEFEEFNVTEQWDANPFDWFKGQGLLLAVGDQNDNNAMTIGWGALGNIWSGYGPATVTVYVAEGRYTYQFMEKYDYFTVMAFDKKDAPILGYMGTHSGRDGDKAQHLGLTTLYTDNGTPYYAEAILVLECKTIYKAPFERDGMSQEIKEFYDNFDAGVHHMYIGNVVKALRRKSL